MNDTEIEVSQLKCWHCDGNHVTADCPSAITKRFVVGFAFDEMRHRVVLIHKDHPAWLAGKYNGIGGKVELDDKNSHAAMRREFLEETGVDTGDVWQHFNSLIDQRGWAIDFFYCERPAALADFVRTTTTEEVKWYSLYTHLSSSPKIPTIDQGLIPNLTWLIPMALSMKHETDHWEGSSRMQVKSFKVTEHGNRLEV